MEETQGWRRGVYARAAQRNEAGEPAPRSRPPGRGRRDLGPPHTRLPISKENLWKAGLQSERSEHSRYSLLPVLFQHPLSLR